MHGEVNGNTGTIFQTGGSGGFINAYGNYIHADGAGGKVYNITSGAVFNLHANRITENTASTKVGATVNKFILLDNDSKTRIYNDVSSKGTEIQGINIYNDSISPVSTGALYFQGSQYGMGTGLDPVFSHVGRSVIYSLSKNASTAIAMNYYQTLTTVNWGAGTYGDLSYVLRYFPSSSIWFKLDGNGACWMPGVYGDVATGGTTLYIAPDGRIGTSTSLTASKTNIENINDTSWLYDLNVVEFNFRDKNEQGEYLETPLTIKKFNGILNQKITVTENGQNEFNINAGKEDKILEIYKNEILAVEGIKNDYVVLDGKLFWFGYENGILAKNDIISINYRDYIDTGIAPKEYGVLIEQVKSINPNLVGQDINGQDKTIRNQLITYAML